MIGISKKLIGLNQKGWSEVMIAKIQANGVCWGGGEEGDFKSFIGLKN